MSKKNYDAWVRTFSVSDPVLHKKGYTLYKVTSKVFPKNSIEAETQVAVWKRYNDFKKLHKALFTIHQSLHLKDTFPPFAKARFFGRFDENVIEERRKSAYELLEFAAKHPPLFTSQVFVKFFEGGHTPPLDCQPSEKQEDTGTILQPVKDELLRSSTVPQFSNCGDSSILSESTECGNSLGGIWKHRQVADDISISSHATEGDDDDDDRTTFTDDDHSISVTPLDLCEFDPLFEVTSETDADLRQEDFCNSWLLSALQSCAQTTSGRPDADCNVASNTLEFPRPFGDLDDHDISTGGTLKKQTDSLDRFEVLPEKNKASGSCLHADLEEFDPLSPKGEPGSVFTESDTISDLHDIQKSSSSQVIQWDGDAYVVKAGKLVGEAQEAELMGCYSSAFACYKSAIDILLLGVQKDILPAQKEAVRRKIFQYLIRAEEIYENHLTQNLQPSQNNEVNVPTSPVPSVETKSLTFRGSLEDLAKFKVLGVLHRVLLVLDISSNRTYVVKTLPKSPNPVTKDVPNIVPQDIPFMVQLYQVYETCYAFFLILEYASGGRVWDYVSSYLHRSPISPSHESSQLYLEHKENVYSGKKLRDDGSTDDSEITAQDGSSTLKLVPNDDSVVLVDPDLTPSEKCPSSYVALFQTYAAYSASENKVSLAKCHFEPQVPESYMQDDYLYITDDATVQNDLLNAFSDHPPEQHIAGSEETHILNGSEPVKGCTVLQKNVSNGVICEGNMKIDEEDGFLCSSSHDVDKFGISTEKVSGDTCEIDVMISNSEALIKNVDHTLNCSNIVMCEGHSNCRQKILSDNDDQTVLPGAYEDSNSSEVVRNLSMPPASQKLNEEMHDVRSTSLPDDNVFTSPGARMNLRNMTDGVSQKSQFEKQKKHVNETGSNVTKPSHHVDGRSRLSSSTGSLEISSSQRVSFTELFHQMDVSRASSQPVRLPESCIRLWAAQMIVALHSLHSLGVIWQDLHPDNLLLGREGDILLTYKSQWNCVDQILSNSSKENMYAAPEVGSIFPVTPACDWWSLGALLFELLTGRSLSSCHPCGITSHTTISIPPGISAEATDLLKKLLKYNAHERLGAGPLGSEEIRAHPFFNSIYWESLTKR